MKRSSAAAASPGRIAGRHETELGEGRLAPGGTVVEATAGNTGLGLALVARAKGLSQQRVLWKHVLRNALLPMVTLIGLQAGTMLGGSVVVESVFSLPGLGRLAYESVVQRDLNTLLGIVFVSALLVITVNFVVDLIYARLDPRIVAEG